MNSPAAAKLLDAFEIQMLKARYCEITDLIPQQGMAVSPCFEDVFAEDLAADYGFGSLKGRPAVVDFLVRRISGRQSWMWHSIHSPQIDLQDDGAKACWTLLAYVKNKDRAQLQTLIGRYVDEFRRTQQGWRISSIRFYGELTLSQPLIQAPATLSVPLKTTAPL